MQNVLDYFNLEIKVKESSEDMPLEWLFEVGARNNKKRAFLFISKLLGKHLAVDPMMTRLGGYLLAEAYHKKMTGRTLHRDTLQACLEDPLHHRAVFESIVETPYQVDRSTLFIGFAETATGIGHSMFAAFEGNASFIHTTREPIISEAPVFAFEEEHSHATGHECYAADKALFTSCEQIILVDDEITTGNTALNLIRALAHQSIAKKYIVASLLDWRNDAQQQAAKDLEKALGIEIIFVSLIQGEIEVELLQDLAAIGIGRLAKPLGDEVSAEYEKWALEIEPLVKKTVRSGEGIVSEKAYLTATGRFGLTALENQVATQKLLHLGEQLKALRKYDKTLCIGTEEFIYGPALIAYGMGEGVRYQSTTRSPILTDASESYPIREALTFAKPEDHSISNYIYNLLPNTWEEIFWIFEREVDEVFMMQMTQALKARGVKKIHFISCDQ